jgi:hypothetical protein
MTNLLTGPEDCKSRMLGSKENSPWADGKDEEDYRDEDLAQADESDSEDKHPASRSDSYLVEKQTRKKLISAVLSNFHARG